MRKRESVRTFKLRNVFFSIYLSSVWFVVVVGFLFVFFCLCCILNFSFAKFANIVCIFLSLSASVWYFGKNFKIDINKNVFIFVFVCLYFFFFLSLNPICVCVYRCVSCIQLYWTLSKTLSVHAKNKSNFSMFVMCVMNVEFWVCVT